MGLVEAAAARAQGSLSPADTFPGVSYADKLVSGRDAARAVILKYVPNFVFDEAASRSAMDQVNAWARRNAATLESTFTQQAGTEKLAQAVQLQMGADLARAFVIAVYTEAARGIGAWSSGAVGRAVAGQLPGVTAGYEWSKQDAEHRLLMFATILQMDRDGTLASMFRQTEAPSGLGLVWYGWVLIAAVVAAAAAVVFIVLGHEVISRNNDRMDDMCRKAQAAGDSATTAKCIQASAELQLAAANPFSSAISAVDLAVKGGLALAALYVGVRYGLPAVRAMRQQRQEARA